MKIKWLIKAVHEFSYIRAYIHLDNPDAANAVAKKIKEVGNKLKNSPDIGRLGRVRNTRELVVSKTPYIFIIESIMIV